MPSAADRAILAILESLPTHPTSGQILGALTRAERAGFERGLGFQLPVRQVAPEASTFLRRQAD